MYLVKKYLLIKGVIAHRRRIMSADSGHYNSTFHRCTRHHMDIKIVHA